MADMTGTSEITDSGSESPPNSDDSPPCQAAKLQAKEMREHEASQAALASPKQGGGEGEYSASSRTMPPPSTVPLKKSVAAHGQTKRPPSPIPSAATRDSSVDTYLGNLSNTSESCRRLEAGLDLADAIENRHKVYARRSHPHGASDAGEDEMSGPAVTNMEVDGVTIAAAPTAACSESSLLQKVETSAAMDVDADSAETVAACTPVAATSAKFSIEPSTGTGTGSEVFDVVREGENAYRVTTKDGCQEVVDEATLTKLPWGMTRLATLQVRERMAAKKAGTGDAYAIVPEDDNGSTAQSTDEPGGEPTPRAAESSDGRKYSDDMRAVAIFGFEPTASTAVVDIDRVYKRIASTIHTGRKPPTQPTAAADMAVLDRARADMVKLRDDAKETAKMLAKQQREIDGQKARHQRQEEKKAAQRQQQTDRDAKKRGADGKSVRYSIVESPPMNVEAARELVRTRDFSNAKPWGGAISMFEVVEAYAKRALRSRKDTNFRFSLDLYSESKLATDVECDLRLVGGYRGGSMPEPTREEERHGVPSFLLGYPLSLAPKIVRYIFFVEVAPPVKEADLVASHLRATLQRARHLGIPSEELAQYVGSEEQVRQFRTDEAINCSPPVTPADIKKLMNATGYGSAGEDWKTQHKVADLPPAARGIKKTVHAVIEQAWGTADEKKKVACLGREHPPLTLHSIEGQIIERQWLNQLKDTVAKECKVPVRGWANDAVLFWSSAPSFESQIAKLVGQMAASGILFSVTSVTMTKDEYKQFALSKCGEICWERLDEDVVEARESVAKFLKWLYPAPGCDEVRPSHPYNYAAAAVAPYIMYNQNFATGKTEWYDVASGVWKYEGGEYMTRGLPLQKVLEEKLRSYRMTAVKKDDGCSYRMSPIADPPHPLLADPGCTNAVGGALKTVNKHYPPLGSNPESKHIVACSNQVTLDFSKPFAEQVRPSRPADRNAQITKWCFVEPCDSEKRQERRQLGTDLANYLLGFDSKEDSQIDIVGQFGQRFLDLMQDGGDPMFQHVYFEPAGGRLDGADPMVGLEEAIYSLRQDIGAGSGMRAGFEEWVLEWGPLGNNGKGQKRDLREAAMSRVDRVEERGYVAVVDASLLKDSKEENRCNEDIVKLKNAREAVIDEISTDNKKFVNTTVRSYAGGGVVSGHGKHEKAQNIETDFLLRLIANDFPEFDRPLKMPDLRRIALIYYPDTFQTAEICAKNSGNPHYRMLVEYKLGVAKYVPLYMEWMRLLAGATKASGQPGMPTKRLWPRPHSSEELLAAQLPEVVEDPADKFVEAFLMPLAEGSVPDSRHEIIQALVLDMNGYVATSGQAYAQAQLKLRNLLVAPDKKWRHRVNGKLEQVYVFVDRDGKPMTLKPATKANLEARRRYIR